MSPYRDRTTLRLFGPCLRSGLERDKPGRAIAWVMAENDMAVWKVVCKWFRYIEEGEAAFKFPDPDFKPRNPKVSITQETADLLITEMDDDFALEKSRWPDGRGPEFSRLPPHARVAFAQELHLATKTMDEMAAEAKKRLKRGEQLPPREAWAITEAY